MYGLDCANEFGRAGAFKLEGFYDVLIGVPERACMFR